MIDVSKKYKKFYKLLFQPQPFGYCETRWYDDRDEAIKFYQDNSDKCSPVRTVCAYSKERIKLLERQVKEGKKQCLR